MPLSFLSKIAGLFIALTLSANSHASLSFAINPNEGGESKPRYLKALTLWLKDHSCFTEVFVTSNTEKADLIFDIRDRKETPPPQLIVTGLNPNSLDSVWLVKTARANGGIKAIQSESIGLLNTHSQIGYQQPWNQLNEAGIFTKDVQVYQTDLYQGLMVLLMHGDVYAMAAPRVLTTQWQKNNAISIVAEKSNSLVAGIWVSPVNSKDKNQRHKIDQCLKAMLSLKRESHRDRKMKVFPEWVNGFEKPAIRR